MWKVVTSSNLNPPLKLFFYSLILTNNNLLLKIYCENIVKILWQYFSIRIFYFLYYFSSFHFIFIHISFFFSFFFFFFFSFFSSTQDTQPPFFLFSFSPQQHSSASHQRERERGLGLHRMHLHRRSNHCSNISTAARHPPHQSAWVRSTRSFFFFFFFHICLF